MCLTLFKEKESTPKYTTEDKKVYKWLRVEDGKIISPFMKYRYELGVLYTSDLRHPMKFGANKGYSKLLLPYMDCFGVIHMFPYRTENREINIGLHSCNSTCSAYRYAANYSTWDWELFECTIPKGSWYYTNHLGEIASNQLIIVKPHG